MSDIGDEFMLPGYTRCPHRKETLPSGIVIVQVGMWKIASVGFLFPMSGERRQPELQRHLLLEISFQQALQRLAVTCFVAGHLMYSVVNSVKQDCRKV